MSGRVVAVEVQVTSTPRVRDVILIVIGIAPAGVAELALRHDTVDVIDHAWTSTRRVA